MRPSIRALSAASASTSPRSLSTCPPSPRPPHMLPRPCCRRSRLPKQTKRRRPCRASRKTAQGLVEECVADAPCGWPPPWQSGAPRCCAGACPPPPQVAPAAASTQSRPTPQHPSHTSTPAPSQAPCPCVAACAGRASRQPASRGAARHACEIPGWLQLPPSAPPPASSPLPAPPAPVADSRPASPGVSAGRCRQARMRDRHSDARAPLVEPRHAPHAAPLSWTCPPPPRSSAAPAAPPHATASPPSVTMDSESSKRKDVHISSGTGCNALATVMLSDARLFKPLARFGLAKLVMLIEALAYSLASRDKADRSRT